MFLAPSGLIVIPVCVSCAAQWYMDTGRPGWGRKETRMISSSPPCEFRLFGSGMKGEGKKGQKSWLAFLIATYTPGPVLWICAK